MALAVKYCNAFAIPRLTTRFNVMDSEHRDITTADCRPGAIPTPESESNDDSDSDSGVGIICSSFWWSRNRSRNRGDWNRSRNRGDWNRGDWNRGDWNRGDWNRGDWNRSWNRNQMTIPHIYVQVPSNIHSGSNPQET